MQSSVEWPVSRVRQQFVDFFKTKKHVFIPSSPVVPLNDPTLLFINAGMNQFKDLFLGTVDPSTEFGQLKRVANSQMCIRAGGKHNDLDDVGRDTYHHTFFEMLGSWSFGDYFKQEAIEWAWELLTEVYGLPKDRLYVTYFEGDAASGLESDEEAKAIWSTLIPEDHIIPGNAKDNFWEMGNTGPCGPCSEIHFDRIGGRNAADLVNKDDPMVIEVWNLVFMQFERRTDGSLVGLPKKHVDTGMGLERLTSILQGVHSNYDTDAWTPIFNAIQEVTGYPKSYAEIRDAPDDDATVAYRVVADHIRCLTTALGDGAMPDSVGRGFVLRRIIRRAVRYGVQFLNAKTGFFTQLVDVVVASLGGFFPHLQDPRTLQRIKAVLKDEEKSFDKTWESGLKQFSRAVEESKGRNSDVISGTDAFILHDRFGFSVDLTCLLAEKVAMRVDLDAFNTEMKSNQVSAGRVAAAKTFLDMHQLEEMKARGYPTTNDGAKYTWEASTGDVVAIYDKKNGTFVDVLTCDNDIGDEDVGIVLDRTGFYAEAGGQIYDTGRIVGADDAVFEVRKVYNLAGYVIHVGNLSKSSHGSISRSSTVQLQVDYARRQLIAANHTTTHALNWVLRQVLEYEKPDSFMEVQQKGSLVTDELLRFDFSYNSKLSNEELDRVEKLLNEKIQAGLEVFRKEVPLDVATTINGLRHMFGEKYPDPVSVLSLGVDVEAMTADPENQKWRDYAVEFCGGTHLRDLRDAQQAVILSEEALMKGVRRMVIATRDEAARALAAAEEFVKQSSDLINGPVSATTVKALSVLKKKVGDSAISLRMKNKLRDDLDTSIKHFNSQLKVLARKAKEMAQAEGKEFAANYDYQNNPFLVRTISQFGAERESLQAYVDAFNSEVKGPVGVFLLGTDGDSGTAVVSMPKEFVDKKLSALEWIKTAVGNGGGKANAAHCGLKSGQAEEAMAHAQEAAVRMKATLDA